MKSPDEFEIDDVAEAEAEVELTAQDLLDLSPLAVSSRVSNPAPAPTAAGVAPASVVSTPASTVKLAPKMAAPASAPPEVKKAGRSAVVFGVCAIVGVIAIAAGVGVVFSKESSATRRTTVLAQSTIPAQPDPYIEEKPELPPVRVKNPFDETEVFELPAGTSKAEARAYVQDVLLKRAAERNR
jgi:hypothetical protein